MASSNPRAYPAHPSLSIRLSRPLLCKSSRPPAAPPHQLTTSQLFLLLHLVAPKPRPALPSERHYITSTASGTPATPRPLPSWYDRWQAERRAGAQRVHAREAFPTPDAGGIEPAELRLSVVFPAYNEEDRVVPTLEEAVEWLDENVGRPGSAKGGPVARRQGRHAPKEEVLGGYEILVVNDGSTDRTVEVVLEFARQKGLHDVVRVVSLERNRGKGGGVTHGLRHVRGEYALFADADGASRFSDVGKLIEGCEEVVDGSHRGVAIGSRAHLVGSEAVVKVFPPFATIRPSPRRLTPIQSAPPSETSSCDPSTSY